MTIRGTLYKKFDIQTLKNDFKKREIVLKVEDGMYPQHVLFQLIQDRVNLIDTYNEGDQLEVDFNLRGREWKSPQGDLKYFNSLDIWRITPVPTEQSASGTAPLPTPPPEAIDVTQMDDDDLPF